MKQWHLWYLSLGLIAVTILLQADFYLPSLNASILFHVFLFYLFKNYFIYLISCCVLSLLLTSV